MLGFIGYGKPGWIGLVWIVLLFVQDAYGDGGRVQGMYPGPMDMVKRQMFNELLSSDTPQLSWPPFPRLWLEKNRQEVITSNTYVGLKVPLAVATGGAKLNIQFRYGLKTTLVMISSRRKQSPKDPISESLDLVYATGTEEKQMLRWDEQKMMAFPDVRDEYPMVGLCAFEASLAVEKGKHLNFEVFGSGQTLEQANIETNTQSIFSNFFQVREDVSVSTYLDKVCDDVFRRDVEQFVLEDFSKMVVEKVVHSNPDSECQPGNSGGGDSTLAGDVSCLDWHRKKFPKTIQGITVARCELEVNGAHRCRLKSRHDVPCPLYMNKENGTYSETRTKSHRLHATRGILENPCDRQSGLKCKMDREPWKVFGVPFWAGVGRCS